MQQREKKLIFSFSFFPELDCDPCHETERQALPLLPIMPGGHKSYLSLHLSNYLCSERNN